MRKFSCAMTVGIAMFAGAAEAQVEDIVVTAQRRSENLQNVPIAVTALTGNVLAASGVRDTLALPQATPGLQLTTQRAATQPFLRGIGSNDTSQGNEASNALYVDGVYYSTLPGILFSFNNIERIEVLKGPQGTLFGRNATGGLIQIITRDPSRDFRGNLQVGYGNYDTKSGSFYISTGLGENVAADLAAVYLDQGHGFGYNPTRAEDVNKRKDFGIRSKWLFNIGDSTELRVTGDYNRVHTDMGTTRNLLPGALGFNGVSTKVGSIYDAQGNARSDGLINQGGIAAKLNHEFDSISLVNITSWRKSRYHSFQDQDNSPTNYVAADLNEKYENFTEELQILSNSQSDVKWIGGLFYMKGKARLDPAQISGLSSNFRLLSRQRTESFAAYGQATIPLFGDRTHLTIGGRYTIDKRKFNARMFNLSGVQTANFPTNSKTFKKPSWRISIDHQLSDDALIYASYNRGFKAGYFNVVNPLNPPIDPEIVDAFEGGLKLDLFDKTVRFNTAAFYYSDRGIQLSRVDQGTTLIFNAAKGRIYGFDTELSYQPSRDLTLRAALSVLHARYIRFPNAPATFPRVGPGGVLLGGNSTVPINAAGNDMVNSPPVTLSLSADYRIPVSFGAFAVNLTYYYNDGFYTDVDNRIRQPHYGVLNGQLGWTNTNEAFSIRLWAKNLADKQYYVATPAIAFGDFGTPAPPRTYGITLESKF